MAGQPTHPRRSAKWPPLWLTAILAAGAASQIPWVAMAFDQEDIEAVESPLVLSVASELESGPRGLYGPYGGEYPLVLIHAPLYYRMAALTAWPLFRRGIDPVTAALAGGRGLSALALVATLAVTYRLARLGGLPARAGGWAALLVAATPVCGGVPFEVRPDMLGIALQTTGILLVASAITALPIRNARLIAAFTCFGLAACVKQHFLVAPLVSLALMARARLPLAPFIRCGLVGLTVVVAYYGAEEWITAGRMSRSIFVAAASVGRVHPADWQNVGNLLLALAWKCVGLILLFAAAGLALVSARGGAGRTAFVAAGTVLIGIVAALTAFQFLSARPGLAGSIAFGVMVVMALVIPSTLSLERPLRGDRVDLILWTYVGAELALTVILWRQSTGGWFNYALQAAILASVLSARALTRAIDLAPSWRAALPIVVAALTVPTFAWTDVNQVLARRAFESKSLARLLENIDRPAPEIFFVDHPGLNRAHGRRALVYDPWLYPVFESLGLAEPRSHWLEAALTSGSVHVVATTSPRHDIDGLARNLPGLGYRLSHKVGPYFVWER